MGTLYNRATGRTLSDIPDCEAVAMRDEWNAGIGVDDWEIL